MAFYRCYRIDPGGNTIGVKNFIASNDTDARDHADKIRSLGGWHSLELWESHRKLGH